MSMKLSEELKWRGLVNQTTYKDVKAIDREPIVFYWGVDPSSDSMTIGNLAIAMLVRHFISHGHRAVLLVGGATGMIGDPDGKTNERDLQSLNEINQNKKNIVIQYHRLFGDQKFEVVDNYDWFRGFNYLEFLRQVGKFVPMRQMLGRDFVQRRLSENGSGISYSEFSYVLIQAYDFLHLFMSKGVTLQVCGADQWGNSIAGVELIRRIKSGEAHVWSAPLIVNPITGLKFGKTEDGAIWLDEKKTTVYQFYQFWLNVDDSDVERFLKIYTLLDQKQITLVMKTFNIDRRKRHAQKVLAYEASSIVHGKKKADAARRATEVLFGQGQFASLNRSDLAMLKKELPFVKAQKNDSLTDLLIKSSLALSSSEANRLVRQGAVAINGRKLNKTLDFSLPRKKGSYLLRCGKNSFAIIEY